MISIINRIVTFTLILSFTLVGCSKLGSDPKKVVIHFMVSIKNERYDQAYSVVSPLDRQKISLASFTEQLSKEAKRMQKIPDQPDVEIKIEGNKGKAHISNWVKGAGINLIFLEGRWWIKK